ncbi:three component ABC system middle component [Fusibacter ferrireducens]|uniref:Uncharacterized protein n=1 Tax=Fusibacter ferrireducens TaxID=2785058 RepID=A0ABR9ZVG0_9FIRM|nr:three component ABC system middle component [Fusibacter ferrireducens]MBF4693976.1 hypothetical protein [Fusibacter ferrireducens]
MIDWNERSPEVANLLNPSFCSVILYSVIIEYEKVSEMSFPFPLAYLVLPIILHKSTRDVINSRTKMSVWIESNPHLLIGFSHRTKSLVSYTNEAIEFLLRLNVITINSDGMSIIKSLGTSIKRYSKDDDEIDSIISKSSHLAKWFYRMNSVENIYIAWGVRP